MSFVEFGSQSTDTPKTPTSRQWIKQNPDNAVSACLVKVVFKPTAYASYTFVTEQDFKVVVEKGSALASYLDGSLSDALLADTCLYVQIKDRQKGSWSLSGLETSEQSWQEFNWGWKSGEVKALRSPKKKASRRGML